jgi:hypothetical protein
MKEHITLLLFLIGTLAYSQKTTINNDSILTITSELIIKNNETLLKKIESKLDKEQRKKIDSLNREILYYKVKEDFYNTSLSEQSSKYIFITSGILAILALISFSVFKFEIHRIKRKTEKKLNKQAEIFEEFKDDFKFLESNSLVTQANMNASIGIHFRNEQNLNLSLGYHIDSTLFHIKYLNSKSENEDEKFKIEECEAILSNISISNEIIEEIIIDEQLKSKTKKQSENYLESINKIYNFENEEVKNNISELRIKIVNYIA